MAFPPYGILAVVIVVPSCPSTNETVYVFVLHIAYSVTVAPSVDVKFLTFCPSLYAVPVPSAFSFHPTNFELADEKPLAVRFFATSNFMLIDDVVPIASVRFLSKAIVYEIGDHCAYIVTEPLSDSVKFVTLCSSVYSVPDDASPRHHPVKL